MKPIFFVLIFSAAIIGCSDEGDSGAYDGIYTGTFYRMRDGVKGETSSVTLNLLGNQYSGTSTTAKYPAICEGTLAVTGNELEFTNTCMWTAEFDWTLILNGRFTATRDGNELILSKQIDPQNGDYYELIKQ